MNTNGPTLSLPKRRLRNVRFAFRLNVDERLALTKLAILEGGLSDAAVLRRLIRQAASDCGVWQVLADPLASSMGESEVPISKRYR